MNFNDVDLTKAPPALRSLLCLLALKGWEEAPVNRFIVRIESWSAATDVLRYALDVFDSRALEWKYPLLTFKGPEATAFMRLYRRATGNPS
jgi:hypothetical protein